jgi:molecular chaperone DnaK (HSP70)
MHTLCVDFGTSSIRAAIRKDRSNLPHPLAIAPTSQIDNASIPSAIYISPGGDEILFGMDALERGLTNRNALLLELSPKLWLSPDNIHSIDAPAVKGLPFTRRQLVAGLLSIAFKATQSAAASLADENDRFIFRISHPVWDPRDAKKLLQVYEALRQAALPEHSRGIKSTMGVSEFERWSERVSLDDIAQRDGIDVKEPVAATLALFPDPEPNSRTAVLVIDIGAGTIDLGLFSSVLPDHAARVKPKLIAMTSPRSVFGAGDVIDQELLSMISERLGTSDPRQLAAFANNIRRSKEQLFDTKRLVFRSVEVLASELAQRTRLREMAHSLERTFTEMLDAASYAFDIQLRASSHRLDKLEVIFAGGGANLNFLTKVIPRVVSMAGAKLIVDKHSAHTPDGFAVEASLARMAVALGGTTRDSAWPETEMKEATLRRALSI